ncbi:[NiFe] hydrogenase metallocenter assembly protein HypD [Pyrodictium delaneyi]|uniref:Hydrogenase formation protein HypD n=1 Tax=Pyrodictium delaneyi TaxID=1273541 RepID=A0A0P0N2F8_9CREN|nr:hydrogenase formation protein HypD [Pyrodictium delaneyi]ALL00452.1 [NiFe] hydrogenase metallocenter assembly protein HypD [Pyrodictium delaneyi]OWJ54185.1 hydrogenase formation protein HypD [Pyrodictium delaneyi]
MERQSARSHLLKALEERLRNQKLARRIVEKIHKLAPVAVQRIGQTPIKIMDFCGTHEYTVTHYGIRSLMPPEVEIVAGPGCPVCITPAYYIDIAIKLSMEGIRVYTYGDAYRLPGSGKRGRDIRSLEEARAAGGDVIVVYSILDAIRMARRDKKPSLFLAVGFETTVPATASPVVAGLVPNNLKIMNIHRLTPPIMRFAFETHKDNPIRGVIAPGHVSTVIGVKSWKFVVDEYGIPTVVAGFEPIDVLLAILEILRQHIEGRPRIVNEYKRVATWEGNIRAQRIMSECCEEIDAAWRGIGFVPRSGLAFRDKYSHVDAFKQYGIKELTPDEWKYDLPPGCRCAEVTLGIVKPTDCPHFMKTCTPGTPYGPCMVSSEGACAVWARFGGGGLAEEIARSLNII